MPILRKRFHEQFAVKLHRDTHAGVEFNCCEKNFKTKEGLHKHKKEVHRKVFKNLCQICRRGFSDKQHFEAHMNMHNKSKPFQCEQCKNEFAGRLVLMNHLSVCATEKKF